MSALEIALRVCKSACIQPIVATRYSLLKEGVLKMKTRVYFTEKEKSVLWDKWQNGESRNSIARSLNRYPSSVGKILSKSGGIRPAARKRAFRALSLSEREEISRGLVLNLSYRTIAKQLSRSPSTISREVARHGGYQNYRACVADAQAWTNALRPKPCKLLGNKELCLIIASKLKQKWSPQQIAGWLKRQHLVSSNLYVSHETIYKTLYIQTRGALKKELLKHLRSKRVMRRSKHSTLKRGSLGKIPNATPIDERPDAVEDRAEAGHWEGDLIEGSAGTYIATLVERQTRYVMLVKVASKKTNDVVSALIKNAQKLPSMLYKTLTWDRGCELSNHKAFTRATNIDVYFCEPRSPWQRGSNENTNRLIREYFPKRSNLSQHNQQKLSAVARQLNERPRKVLEYETPAARFNACVAATG
jgi:IS30 family transposase